MDDQADLEATVATPRIVVPSNATPVEPVILHEPPDVPGVVPLSTLAPEQPRSPQRPTYVFGNPFAYALRRLLAFVLDLVLVTSVATMLLYGSIAINPFTGLPNASEGGFDATFGVGLGIAFVYLWLFEAIVGTTLGKLAFSLHVYAPKHRIVGLGRAFVRNLLRPIDLLAIGIVLALLPGHRRLGDLLSGTLVARSPLRAFSPLLGWVAVIALAALPFVLAGGTTTVLAVAAAFVSYIPPLVAHMFAAIAALFGSAPPHLTA